MMKAKLFGIVASLLILTSCGYYAKNYGCNCALELRSEYVPLGETISENGQSETLSSITLEQSEIILAGWAENIDPETLRSRSSQVQFALTPLQETNPFPEASEDSIFSQITLDNANSSILQENVTKSSGSVKDFSYDFKIHLPYLGPLHEALGKEGVLLIQGVVVRVESAPVQYETFHYANFQQIQDHVTDGVTSSNK
jgi:hypothetical protein